MQCSGEFVKRIRRLCKTMRGVDSHGGTTLGEISPPASSEELLGALRGGSSAPSRLDELLKEAKAIDLPRLRGYSVKLSPYSKKILSRDNPLVKRKKRKKYKTRADMKAKAKRRWKATYEAKALLDEEMCYRFYKTKYADRWKITPEEWGYIWAEYDLDGSSPIVSGLPGLGDLTPYTILIRSRQEKNLRDTIYDGQSREIEELML